MSLNVLFCQYQHILTPLDDTITYNKVFNCGCIMAVREVGNQPKTLLYDALDDARQYKSKEYVSMHSVVQKAKTAGAVMILSS